LRTKRRPEIDATEQKIERLIAQAIPTKVEEGSNGTASHN
jgi:hypothetical protein